MRWQTRRARADPAPYRYLVRGWKSHSLFIEAGFCYDRNMQNICGVILAAGEGKRIGASEQGIPKVMFKVKGQPMIRYAVDHTKAAGIKDVILVVGFRKEKIMDYFGDQVEYAIQDQILGTGHAVMMTKNLVHTKYDGVMVSYGDHVLYRPETMKNLIQVFKTEDPTIAMLTNFFDDPVRYAFGRIIRNEKGEIIAVVEHKDCTPEQLKIKECNPGFYIFDVAWLYENIGQLKNDNIQKEYYLTDMIKLAVDQGKKISSYTVKDWHEVIGINNLDHLAEVENLLK